MLDSGLPPYMEKTLPGPCCHFKKSFRKNPNANEGCFCSPDGKVTDCVGPYVIATHSESMSGLGPFIVIGTGCVAAMAEKVVPKAMREPAPAVEAEVDVAGVLAEASLQQLVLAVSARVEAE